MKTNTLFGSLLLISLTLLTACKKEEETPTLDTNKQIILPRVAPIPATSTYVQPANPQTVAQPAQTITQSQPVANQQQVATKPGMNPPHGQPGHRCDIAVGAPLNSKPNATATPNTSSQPAFTKTVIPNSAQQAKSTGTTATTSATPAILNPNTASVPAGTNPPHGQPGHVCGTPVSTPVSTPAK